MSLEKNSKEEEFFVSRMKQVLTQSDLIALRRAFGSTLLDANGAALTAFYKICPKDEEKEEAAYLAACSIAYIMYYGYGNELFSQCLRKAEISESRIKALLSNRWVDKDGFFHSKYSRLMRYVISKGYIPSINEVYPSLTNWWKYRTDFIKEFYK